jgi:hypothetical protein
LSRPDTGSRTAFARAKGLEVQPTVASEQRTVGDAWSQGLSIAAVSLGLLAVALALFSVIRREEKLLPGVAAALGIGAITFQVMWIVIGAVVMIMIIYAVLDHLDVF